MTSEHVRDLLALPTWQLLDSPVICGDSLEVLADMPPESIDAVVTDPPYGLGFMGHEWDQPGRYAATSRRRGHESSRRTAFGGEPHPAMEAGRYDLSHSSNARFQARFQAWCESWAREAFRVLKPGGHLLAFGGTRTYHRLVCGVEDAGFEIRDRTLTLNGHLLGAELDWLYGSGWPKSRDIGKAIDDRAGAEREVIGQRDRYLDGVPRNVGNQTGARYAGGDSEGARSFSVNGVADITAPATPEAAEWQGWGTALKPAHEPIVVARKPMRKSVEAQVLATGTGALNIDATRIPTGASPSAARRQGSASHLNRTSGTGWSDRSTPKRYAEARAGEQLGRWPANLALVHANDCQQVGERVVAGDQRAGTDQVDAGRSWLHEPGPKPGGPVHGDEVVAAWDCSPDCPVRMLDEMAGERRSGEPGKHKGSPNLSPAYGDDYRADGEPMTGYGDSGAASRFFLSVHAVEGEAMFGACSASTAPADESSDRESPPRGSAPAPARPALGTGPRCPARSTSDTPNGSSESDASGTPTTPSTAAAPLLALLRAKRSLTRSPARHAEQTMPTDTTTTTTSPSPFDGSAELATSLSTSLSVDLGVPGCDTRSARFHYSAKSSPGEREYGLRQSNPHPTVKPINLMRWLVRLVAPPGGIVLDLFAGSGTTGCACSLEDVEFVGVERDPTFAAIARARYSAWAAFPPGTTVESVLAAEGARRRMLAERREVAVARAAAGQLDLLGGT